jgi:hypothetical protein
VSKDWLKSSRDSHHQLVVCTDEIGPANKGALPDSFDPEHDTIRHEVLWGNLMAGGAGVEWYFGYRYPDSDLSCEDWRSRDKLWDQTRIALDFFYKYLPFVEMSNADEITASKIDYCLSKTGEIYAIYLPDGKSTWIKLPAGDYTVNWFNPRTGGELQPGSIMSLSVHNVANTGDPPSIDGRDWICLIRKK